MAHQPKAVHPMAVNQLNTLVLDLGAEPWQSVAVLPQMLSWQHQLAPITDDNQTDYWQYDFLQQQLEKIEQNQLQTIPMHQGFLYIFCNGFLVTEYQITPPKADGQLPILQRIDLEQYAGCDERKPLAEESYLIELLYGGDNEQHYEIAYSEYQWPWLLINSYGGVSESLDFNGFSHAFVLDQAKTAGVILAAEDERILDSSVQACKARRQARFSEFSLQKVLQYIPFDQEIEIPTTQVKAELPDEIIAKYPELQQQAEFTNPCNWVAYCTIEHTHALALELINNFNTANAGLDSLVKAMGDGERLKALKADLDLKDKQANHKKVYAEGDQPKSEFEKLFPNAEHIELAILTTQLYYSTPQAGKNKTRWQRDNLYTQFTDQLAYSDVQATLKSSERAIYRNMMLVLIEQLGKVMMPEAQSSVSWQTNQGATLDNIRLNDQLVAYLQDLKANPFKPDLTEQEYENSTLLIPSAHQRWQVTGDLLYPFSIDPNALGVLFEGESSYHDNFIENLQANKDIGKKLQTAILGGEHIIGKVCLPEFIADPDNQTFSYEAALAAFFNYEPNTASDESIVEAKQNSEFAKDLFQQWQQIVSFNQKKIASKPKDLIFSQWLKEDGVSWGLLIFKSINSIFLPKLTMTVNAVFNGDSQVNERNYRNISQLINSTSPFAIKKMTIEAVFKNRDDNRHLAKKTRIHLISDFLVERQQAPDARGDSQSYNDKVYQQRAAQKSKKLYKSFDQVVTTEQLTYDEYEAMKSAPENKKMVVLSPDESKLWQEFIKKPILVAQTAEQSRQGAINHAVAQGQVAIGINSLFLMLDVLNLVNSLYLLKHNTDDKKQALMLWGLAGSILGTASGAYSLLDAMNKVTHVSQNTGRIAQFSKFMMANRQGGWQLSRYAVGTKYLPLVGSTIALGLSINELTKSISKGDDVAYIHAIALGSAFTAMLGLFVWGAVLGPIGIGLAIASFILGKYIFKQDDLLGEWLSHGVFSRANKNYMTLAEYKGQWRPQHPFSGQFQSGDETKLMEADTGWFADEGDEKPMSLLSVTLPNGRTQLVFDQNYTLLGVDFGFDEHDMSHYGANTSQFQLTEDKALVPIDKWSKQLSLGDQPLGVIGSPLGQTANEVRHRISQVYAQAKDQAKDQASIDVDRSKRGTKTRFFPWGFGNDEIEKYIEPFKNYPEANVEALLNATYPLKISSKMYAPVGKKPVRAGRADNRQGNNIAITLEVPYFIENQSRLIVELRHDGSGKHRYDNQVVPIDEQGNYRLEIAAIYDLPEFEPDKHSKIDSDKVQYQIYKISPKPASEPEVITKQTSRGKRTVSISKATLAKEVMQVVIIANIKPSQIHQFNDRQLAITTWARLSVNGTSETETEREDVNGQKLKAIWMPFRSEQGWADFGHGLYTSRLVATDQIKTPSHDPSDTSSEMLTEYSSVDADWINASVNDKARC
ncbi:hypothetical protein HR060_17225 [Catenovulum sp. SM1970]|uniref:hypothetical protein n=1 Tax=Marinifaba aquimaris TaxID=2741323 RepID=UPI001573BE06|nr:hypothetical protein [Marinifaba aquimaris]NTS78588.1 hypothetical protein [Marinifaba aquimaris]